MSQKCWHKPPSETKLVQKERKNLRGKHLRGSLERENQKSRKKLIFFWFQKKIQKLLLSSVVSLVWFLVVVACAYFIRGK